MWVRDNPVDHKYWATGTKSHIVNTSTATSNSSWSGLLAMPYQILQSVPITFACSIPNPGMPRLAHTAITNKMAQQFQAMPKMQPNHREVQGLQPSNLQVRVRILLQMWVSVAALPPVQPVGIRSRCWMQWVPVLRVQCYNEGDLGIAIDCSVRCSHDGGICGRGARDSVRLGPAGLHLWVFGVLQIKLHQINQQLL